MAIPALREADRKDLAETIERAIHVRRVNLRGLRGEEADFVRQRAPSLGQTVEILVLAAKLWREFGNEDKAETIAEILRLKAKHNVVVLGHNYMEPLVFDLSSEEERGDSLQLSMYAARTDAETILFNGVVFMAET
ncbi:MAG: quinolinate synthase NadA, partial [Planctomycetes bacterium]|nr:quinolinate synthase NadA [Planctomycetota bacterium]